MTIELLTEVIRQNPYKEMNAKNVWIDIALTITELWKDATKVLTDRTAKSHTKSAVDEYKKEKNESRKKYDVEMLIY